MEQKSPAVQGPLDGGVRPLVPCPLCGALDGYTVEDGSTCRWWAVLCKECGEQVCECRAGSTLWAAVQRTPIADAAWNAAGAYADGMRQALNKIAERTGSDDPCRALVQIARDALAAA